MNDDTIRMAREAGCIGPSEGGDPNGLWEPHGHENVTELMFAFAALVRADERERLYGKDIDTFLFEEHQLAFEKGRRSEREACAQVCDSWSLRDSLAADMAEEIRARGNT